MRCKAGPVHNGNGAGKLGNKGGKHLSACPQHPMHLPDTLLSFFFSQQVIQRAKKQYGIEHAIRIAAQIQGIDYIAGADVGSGIDCQFILCLLNQGRGKVCQIQGVALPGQRESVGTGCTAKIQNGG